MSTATSNQTTTSHVYDLDPSHTTVEFVARHLMISKVRGRFTGVTGSITIPDGGTIPASVVVEIDPATLDTREEQRDAHLTSPDFLDAALFPRLSFSSTRIEGEGESFRVYGDLTIHGVTREIALDATYEGHTNDPWGNQRVGYEAHGKISRKDFGLNWNLALETGGVVVGDEVKIEINAEAIAQK